MKGVIKKRGFTLIEILVVIGLIAVLAGVVLVAINPGRQFAQGRDSQRVSNMNAILNAVGQRMADNKGTFAGVNPANGLTCNALPSSTTTITTTSGAGQGELGCLVPTYLPAMLFDPSTGTGTNTGYSIRTDDNGRVWVAAMATEPSIPRNTDLYVVR